MATFGYAVTFERTTLPPVTVRGTVEAGSAHTATSRAVKAARRGLPKLRWTSLVVLLERASGEDAS